LGPQSRIGLSYLGVEQPHFHLIVDKNGRTNQPVPKHSTQSSEPIQDTLIDLQAKLVELSQGLVVVNDQALPFDLVAKDLAAKVAYLWLTCRRRWRPSRMYSRGLPSMLCWVAILPS
jgi:translocation and assembly module TamB